MVAHLISYEELSRFGLFARFVKGRVRVHGVNAVGVSEYVDRTPEELVALVREHAVPQGLTAGFGGAIALTDGTNHHQDIRRPLGVPREVPPERLVASLSMALRSPTLPGRRNVRDLRLVATDINWASGDGPDVTGAGEGLLMAVAGRPDALPDLEGPGVDTLAERLAS